MIFKSLLLSLCLLTGCDQNITRNSTKLQRIVKVQLPPNDSSYELEYTYWDNELEIVCEWVKVRDMEFCLPKKGRIIYSVYDNCTRPVGGFDPQYLSYMRVDTVPEPTVYRMGKLFNLSAPKYNELIAGKYCVTFSPETKDRMFLWAELEVEPSLEIFKSR